MRNKKAAIATLFIVKTVPLSGAYDIFLFDKNKAITINRLNKLGIVKEDIYDFSTSDAQISTSAGYIEFVKEITAIYPYLGTLAVFHSNSSCLLAIDNNSGFFENLMEVHA